jgi:hypothetical protein
LLLQGGGRREAGLCSAVRGQADTRCACCEGSTLLPRGKHALMGTIGLGRAHKRREQRRSAGAQEHRAHTSLPGTPASKFIRGVGRPVCMVHSQVSFYVRVQTRAQCATWLSRLQEKITSIQSALGGAFTGTSVNVCARACAWVWALTRVRPATAGEPPAPARAEVDPDEIDGQGLML